MIINLSVPVHSEPACEQNRTERQTVNSFSFIRTHILHSSTLFLAALLLLVPAVSAYDADAVSWNVSQTTYGASFIGDTIHIDPISWWVLFGVGILFFLASLKWAFANCTDILSAISTIIFGVLTLTGFFVQSWSYEVVTVQLNETAQIGVLPVVYTQPAWVCMISGLMFVVCVVNLYRIYILTMVKSMDNSALSRLK